MCGAVHTPNVVTNKTKIYVVVAAGEAPHIVERVGWRQGTGGGDYTEESEFGSGICWCTGMLRFWAPTTMCVFDICVVDTDEP